MWPPTSRSARYVEHLDFERDLVFGVFNRRLQLLAMAHLAFEPPADPPAAAVEFGVSVLERARGRGYGARLFDHAVTARPQPRRET